MKTRTTLTAALLAATSLTAGSASAATIVGWYDFGASGNNGHELPGDAKAQDQASAGATGTLFGGDGDRGGFSSTDGTYGPTQATDQGAPATGDGGFSIRQLSGDETVVFTITNGGLLPIRLDEFVFDYMPIESGTNGISATDELILSYASGDLSDSDNTTIGTLTNLGIDLGDNVNNYYDHSFSLAGLEDQTLAAGESATFNLVGTTAGATGGTTEDSEGVPVALDNLAFLGEAVPEPGSLALLGLGGLLIGARRRRD